MQRCLSPFAVQSCSDACLSAFFAPAAAAAGGVYFVEAGDTLTTFRGSFASHVAAWARERPPDRRADAGDRIRIPDAVSDAPAGHRGAPGSARSNSERVLQAICRDETVYHRGPRATPCSRSEPLFRRPRPPAAAQRHEEEGPPLIGQKIIVRKSGPRSHTVRRGETLSRIATRYGVPRPTPDEPTGRGQASPRDSGCSIVPCDPYAVAGSTPPPLGVPDSAAA